MDGDNLSPIDYTIKKSFIKRKFWCMPLFGQLVKVEFNNWPNILCKIIYAIIGGGKVLVNFNIFLKGKRISKGGLMPLSFLYCYSCSKFAGGV